MTAARRISLELPWSEAVMRILETNSYIILARHSDAFIASKLGLREEDVHEIIAALCDAGAIRRDTDSFRGDDKLSVDTRVDDDTVKRLRRHWARAAFEHLTSDRDAWFAYNVISVSKTDLERIEQRLRAAYREVRAIVQDSQPSERAALLTLQLTRW